MVFQEIKTTEKIATFDTSTNEKLAMYIKPIINNVKEAPKYQVFLDNVDGSLQVKGYIYFYLDEEIYQSQFIGMRINPRFENRNYASLLISEYIDFCYHSHIYDLTTHSKQRKPEILHILKKYGYELDAVTDINNKSIVHILSDKKNTFFIPNKNTRKALEHSNLAKENNYHFVDFIHDQSILDTVYLNETYRLSNYGLYLKKKELIQQQFPKS